MVPLTSELKLVVDAHLRGEQAGRFANRLPSSIFVQTFKAIAALIECTSQSWELAQRSCLPGKSARRLLHMAALKHLGLIDLSHKLQVHCMVPFLLLLLWCPRVEVLHGAPRCEQYLIRYFLLETL